MLQSRREAQSLTFCCAQDAKHLTILTDILEDEQAPLSLKVAVCTILRAAAHSDAVSMSALTQVPAESQS